MATNGTVTSSKQDYEPESESNCSTCKESGCIKEASCFCQNCDKHFCTVCLGYHDKFLKGHTVLGSEQKTEWSKPQVQRVMERECSDHAGNMILMYCPKHDIVCCPVCAALKHSVECHGWMSYIPDIAKGLSSSQEYHGVLDQIDSLVDGFTKTEKKLREHTKLQDAKAESAKMTKGLKDRVMKTLTELEEKTIAQMDKLTESLELADEKDIDGCVTQAKKLEEIKQQLKNSETSDEIGLFIAMKASLKQIGEHESCLFKLASDNVIKITIDDDVQYGIESLEKALSYGILKLPGSDERRKSDDSSENGGQQLGTNVKYHPQIMEEANNTGQFCVGRYHTITAMKEYESKSLEELRLDDYMANRKGQTEEPTLENSTKGAVQYRRTSIWTSSKDNMQCPMIVDSAREFVCTETKPSTNPLTGTSVFTFSVGQSASSSKAELSNLKASTKTESGTTTKTFSRSNTSGSSLGSQQLGTKVKFHPPTIEEVNNTMQICVGRYHTITAMKEYESKSLEELRLDDYMANRKGQTEEPTLENTTKSVVQYRRTNIWTSSKDNVQCPMVVDSANEFVPTETKPSTNPVTGTSAFAFSARQSASSSKAELSNLKAFTKTESKTTTKTFSSSYTSGSSCDIVTTNSLNKGCNTKSEETKAICENNEEKKVGKVTSTEKTSETAASGQKCDLASMFKPKAVTWTCSGCYVRNNGDVFRCPCCKTLNPGVQKEDIPQQEPETNPGTSGSSSFTFGSHQPFQTNNSGGFTLGTKPTDTTTPKITETKAEKPKKKVNKTKKKVMVTTTADAHKPFSGFSFTTPIQSASKTSTSTTQSTEAFMLTQLVSKQPEILSAGHTATAATVSMSIPQKTVFQGFTTANAPQHVSGFSFGSQLPIQTGISGGFTLSTKPADTVTSGRTGGFRFGNQTDEEEDNNNPDQNLIKGWQFGNKPGLKSTVSYSPQHQAGDINHRNAEICPKVVIGQDGRNQAQQVPPQLPGAGFFFQQIQQAMFTKSPSPSRRDPSKCVRSDDYVDEYEPNVDFKPVVPLPDLAEVKTGEENEEKLFVLSGGDVKAEKLAVRFKNKDIADNFKKTIETCKDKMDDEVGQPENTDSQQKNEETKAAEQVKEPEKKEEMLPIAEKTSETAASGQDNEEKEADKFSMTPKLEAQKPQQAAKLGGGFNFLFACAPSMPSKTSPLKSRGVTSPVSTVLTDGGYDVIKEDDNSHIHVEPIIQLPDKVEVKTSEEDEESIGATADSTSETPSSSDEIVFVKEVSATAEEIAKARELMLPDHFFLYWLKPPCPGCLGCEEELKSASDQVQADNGDVNEYEDEETEDDKDNDNEDVDENEEAVGV